MKNTQIYVPYLILYTHFHKDGLTYKYDIPPDKSTNLAGSQTE